ncbi:MAG TPA: hypothetical protein PK313_01205 [Myxococcota bacterium]|nr:hypothetical protein [Myxococcota bacterium]
MLHSRVLPFLLVAFMMAALAGCEGDSGTTTDPGSGPVDHGNPSDPGVQPDNGSTDDGTPPGRFTGQLVDFQSKVGMEGVDVTVLDNDTGEPLDPVRFPPFKSGVNGLIDLPLDPGMMVAFKANGKDKSGVWTFKDSFQYNIPSDAQNKRLYAVNVITYSTAPKTAGIIVDKTKGILAGTVYWKNEAEGTEEFVGCVTIEALVADGSSTTPQGEVRYFSPDTDMPTPLTKATFTTTGEEGTSRYIIANLPVGQYRIVASIDGTVVSDEIVLRAAADSIAISNIYLEGDTNPTPDRTECIGVRNEM